MSAEAAMRKAQGRLTGPVRIHLQRIRSMVTAGAGGDVLGRELGELDNEIVGTAAMLEPAKPNPAVVSGAYPPRCSCLQKTRRSAPPCPVHDTLPGIGSS